MDPNPNPFYYEGQVLLSEDLEWSFLADADSSHIQGVKGQPLQLDMSQLNAPELEMRAPDLFDWSTSRLEDSQHLPSLASSSVATCSTSSAATVRSLSSNNTNGSRRGRKIRATKTAFAASYVCEHPGCGRQYRWPKDLREHNSVHHGHVKKANDKKSSRESSLERYLSQPLPLVMAEHHRGTHAAEDLNMLLDYDAITRAVSGMDTVNSGQSSLEFMYPWTLTPRSPSSSLSTMPYSRTTSSDQSWVYTPQSPPSSIPIMSHNWPSDDAPRPVPSLAYTNASYPTASHDITCDDGTVPVLSCQGTSAVPCTTKEHLGDFDDAQPAHYSLTIDSVQSGKVSTGLCSSDSDHLDMTDESSDSHGSDTLDDIELEKEQIIDRLMVCVYDIFASASPITHVTPGYTESSRSPNRQSAQAFERTGKKRKRREERDDNDDDRDEDDDIRKRSKGSGDLNKPGQGLELLFACPYYKRDPHKRHSSGACCGPGWNSIHRIKSHLYRVHAIPLHCRRCYEVFANEILLTEHSRSAKGCAMRDPIQMEGFDKDQEKALKGRKTMFQAGSEEEKWKIIYLILFPDTALGEMPSPYYNLRADDSPKHLALGSPKAPELKEFDAFLRRELPRAIRKTLQTALESRIGLIEETLKNELETIIRDTQETLTRSYMGSTPSCSLTPAAEMISSTESRPPQSVVTNEHRPAPSGGSKTEALSQYCVPPDAALASLPELAHSFSEGKAYTTSSDSAYQSMSSNWIDPMPDTELHFDPIFSNFGDLGLEFPEFMAFNSFGSFSNPLEDQPSEEYTGKGKGRAKYGGHAQGNER